MRTHRGHSNPDSDDSAVIYLGIRTPFLRRQTQLLLIESETLTELGSGEFQLQAHAHGWRSSSYDYAHKRIKNTDQPAHTYENHC